ncbi:hypothetical protein DFQ27_004712 [Actinomortierella ambigua]|uniref:dolichol kinase n=1 Tax=Actinomortierella ambigua TaxID=1343610 RepID=A0A9P6QK25_9FUNG|nr:hypothetical protein DFQ27_004712 [Actinomortierella ambigua]
MTIGREAQAGTIGDPSASTSLSHKPSSKERSITRMASLPSSASSSSIDSTATLLDHHSHSHSGPDRTQPSDMSDMDQQEDHDDSDLGLCPTLSSASSLPLLSRSLGSTLLPSADIAPHTSASEASDKDIPKQDAFTLDASSNRHLFKDEKDQEPTSCWSADRGSSSPVEATNTTTVFSPSSSIISTTASTTATATAPTQGRSSPSRTPVAPLTPISKPASPSLSPPPPPPLPPSSSSLPLTTATAPSPIRGNGDSIQKSVSSTTASSPLGLGLLLPITSAHPSHHHHTHAGNNASPTTPATGSTSATASSGAMNSLAKKRQLNLLRVRIERGLVVSMALLAAYRIMALQESTLFDILSTNTTSLLPGGVIGGYTWSSQQPQQQPGVAPMAAALVSNSGKTLVKNAFALGAALLLLVAIHALVLQTHDHRIEFSLHNKILPLQPITKRSSRLFKDADDDEDDDDESEDDTRMTKEEWLEQEALAQTQTGHHPSHLLHPPAFHSSQSHYYGVQPGDDWTHARQQRTTRSLNWRVFGTEPHWYRKGADSGSIFATILVPVALISKFHHVIQEHVLAGTQLSLSDYKTLEALLCSLSLSLTFGFSILVHMGLLKLFEDHRDLLSPRSKESAMFAENGTMLDSLYLLPEAVAQATSTGARIGGGSSLSPSSSLYPRQKYLHSPEASMGPSPAPSTTISAAATPSTRSINSSPVLSATGLAQQPFSPSSSSLAWSASERPMLQRSVSTESQQDNLVFSSDQLMIHPSLLVGTSETEAHNEREEKWILALGVGGAYTFGLVLLTRFQWLPGLERTSAGMVLLTQSVFQLLMLFSANFFKRSFTFGEMVVLVQAVTLMVHETLIMYFGQDGLFARSIHHHSKGNEHHGQQQQQQHQQPELMPGSFHSPQFMFMLTLIVGMMVIGLLLSPLLVYCRRLAQLPRKGQTSINMRRRGLKQRVAAAGVYLGTMVIVAGVIMPQTSKVLGQNPFQWLVDFMLMTTVDWTGMWAQMNWRANAMLFGPNSTATLAAAEGLGEGGWSLMELLLSIGWRRALLCLYWVSGITMSILFLEWMKTSARRRAIMGSLNNRRKFYHALAVIMFTPGFLFDKPFMHLAFSVAVASMVFLEYIRYFAVYPIGKEIHLFLVGFLDDRDRGPIILSHLYLLIGCAAPVWLAGQDVLAGLSGIFALGFGDAMASIVGRRWGRHRWPGTVKTVEGTAAFVASILLAAGVIQVLLWLFVQDQTLSPVLDGLIRMQIPPGLAAVMAESESHGMVLRVLGTMVLGAIGAIARYGLAVSGAAMLEAVSEQNDNLVIPVAMLAVVWLL